MASLFSREFYRFVPKHLKPKGLFVQWIQLYEIDDELVSTVINALQESFVDYRVYMSNFGDMMLVASADGPVGEIDTSRLAGSEMQALLYRVGLEKPGDLEFHQISNRKGLESFTTSLGKRANSDFYPILSLEAPKSRFRSTMAAGLISLPTADLPFVEILGKIALPAGILTSNRVYPRTMYRKMAGVIVDARGDKDPADITAELRVKMGFLREQIGRCRSADDVKTQLSSLRQMAAETIPYLRPEEMQGLWIRPDWIHCSAQAVPVPAMLAVLEASASRNHAATLALTEALLTSNLPDLSDDTADYLLRSAMLAAVAIDDFAAVQRLNVSFGEKVQSTQVTKMQRDWLLQIAKTGASTKPVEAAPSVH